MFSDRRLHNHTNDFLDWKSAASSRGVSKRFFQYVSPIPTSKQRDDLILQLQKNKQQFLEKLRNAIYAVRGARLYTLAWSDETIKNCRENYIEKINRINTDELRIQRVMVPAGGMLGVFMGWLCNKISASESNSSMKVGAVLGLITMYLIFRHTSPIKHEKLLCLKVIEACDSILSINARIKSIESDIKQQDENAVSRKVLLL